VPVPFLLHKDSGELHPSTLEILDIAADMVQAGGIESWSRATVEDICKALAKTGKAFNALASDYTRYLPANTNSRQLGWAAGLGNWFATSLLMSVGAVAWTVDSDDGNPTENFTGLLHNDVLAALVLLGIAVGSVGANVLNVYSGAMSFLAMGFKLGFKTRRAIMVALAGIIGSITAFAAIKGDFVGSFEGFLLVVSYWVAPWIAVSLTDWLLRGRKLDAKLETSTNWAGPVAFVVATVVSIWGFCNQIAYTGPLAKAWAVGDITPLVGFVLAAALYALLFKSATKK
jgi:NCS1 family nucleobase:cation symporter-1